MAKMSGWDKIYKAHKGTLDKKKSAFNAAKASMKDLDKKVAAHKAESDKFKKEDVDESFAQKMKTKDQDLRTKSGRKFRDVMKAIEARNKKMDESFKPGKLKLNDGSSITVSKNDAMLLNDLEKNLSGPNKKEMMGKLMKSKNEYKDVLNFAKETL